MAKSLYDMDMHDERKAMTPMLRGWQKQHCIQWTRRADIVWCMLCLMPVHHKTINWIDFAGKNISEYAVILHAPVRTEASTDSLPLYTSTMLLYRKSDGSLNALSVCIQACKKCVHRHTVCIVTQWA